MMMTMTKFKLFFIRLLKIYLYIFFILFKFEFIKIDEKKYFKKQKINKVFVLSI